MKKKSRMWVPDKDTVLCLDFIGPCCNAARLFTLLEPHLTGLEVSCCTSSSYPILLCTTAIFVWWVHVCGPWLEAGPAIRNLACMYEEAMACMSACPAETLSQVDAAAVVNHHP